MSTICAVRACVSASCKSRWNVAHKRAGDDVEYLRLIMYTDAERVGERDRESERERFCDGKRASVVAVARYVNLYKFTWTII